MHIDAKELSLTETMSFYFGNSHLFRLGFGKNLYIKVFPNKNNFLVTTHVVFKDTVESSYIFNVSFSLK